MPIPGTAGRTRQRQRRLHIYGWETGMNLTLQEGPGTARDETDDRRTDDRTLIFVQCPAKAVEPSPTPLELVSESQSSESQRTVTHY